MNSKLIRRVDWLDHVGSTNDYLRQFTGSGLPRAAVAVSQSSGRGRHGRTWHSPPGEGLYASFLLFPGWPSRRAPLLNAISALAVMEVIQEMMGDILISPSNSEGNRPAIRIKLPNDVLLNGRKIAGILVETATCREKIQWAIAGIGINLSQEVFPAHDFRVPPTSLRLEGCEPEGTEEVFHRLVLQLERLFLKAEMGKSDRIEEDFQKATDRSLEGLYEHF